MQQAGPTEIAPAAWQGFEAEFAEPEHVEEPAVQSVLILLIAWSTVVFQGNLGRFGELDRRSWTYLLLAGVVTGVSSLLLYRALKLGNTSRVVPLDRLSLVFAILLGSVFLKEKVGWQVIVGGGLMAVGALVIASASE